jgi:hypothetical protein|mmetsp:Transcript_18525/g.33563  ORF Transcript_18525/g.33563 Transcript_18525/m.33563 type:complete len:125 (+) Transcript_18525:730-1104(+)
MTGRDLKDPPIYCTIKGRTTCGKQFEWRIVDLKKLQVNTLPIILSDCRSPFFWRLINDDMSLDDAPSFRPYYVSNEPPTYCTFEEETKNGEQFEWRNIDPAKSLGELSTNFFSSPFSLLLAPSQ